MILVSPVVHWRVKDNQEIEDPSFRWREQSGKNLESQ